MKRKVFLIRNVAPEMYGGGETYQLKIAQLLKNNGFEPYIVSASKELLRVAKNSGFKVIESIYIERQNWSGWKNLLFPLYFLRILKLRKWYRDIFKKHKPQTINIQSRDDWIAATGVAKKMGITVLWTDHMDFRSWVLKNVEKPYKNIIGKWVLRCAQKADKIIMISDFEREYFEGKVFQREYSNIVTIKNGVLDEYDSFKSVKQKKDSIIYIGRIVEYKGVRELIKAFEVVSRKYPNAVLNIYGDGENLEEYKKLAENDNRISFYGRTDEPLKRIAENEIFVLPSYREGLSLSLLDAAMMQKIIIASKVDGNPEVVINKRTGILVPAKNENELADALKWVLGNKDEAKRMARDGRKYFKENFDLETIFLRKMLSLYNYKKEEQ